MGIMVFIVGYEKECEKSFSTKEGALASDSRLG